MSAIGVTADPLAVCTALATLPEPLDRDDILAVDGGNWRNWIGSHGGPGAG